MTLTEIISSDAEITESLLKENNITSHEVLSNTDLSLVNVERYVDCLHAIDKSHNNFIKFLIMFYSIRLGRLEIAYEYAEYLYKNEYRFKNDSALYILMLEDLLGIKKNRITIKDVLLDRYDDRFIDVNFENKIRTDIFNHKYESARNKYKRLFRTSKSLAYSEAAIYSLLKAAKQKDFEKINELIDACDISSLVKYFKTMDLDGKTYNNYMDLCGVLSDVLYGLPLNTTDLPKTYDIYDLIASRDIEKIIKSNNNPILVALAKKIKSTIDKNIVYDYKGELSEYFYDTLEKLYESLINKDIDSAIRIICEYLDSINKDNWCIYIANLIEALESDFEHLSEEEFTLRVAEIYDMLVLVSRGLSEETENRLADKYMKEETVHPYSKANKLDIEYNYNIDGIEDIIKNVHDGTINYGVYADMTSYSEEDVFKVVIMARENYRIGNFKIGDILISIASDLVSRNFESASELRAFIKAIKNNKDILRDRKAIPFSEEVHKLLMK